MASIHKRKLRNGDIVWELTHGTGRDRQRFIAGRTKAEATTVLTQFEQQIAVHGEAPEGVSVSDAVERYVVFLKGNRRASTVRRYGRVLQTFDRCFLKIYHPDISRLRDVRPAYIESYKQRRSNGEVTESKRDSERQREEALRERQRKHPHGLRRRDNAVYGWLGRKRLRRTVVPRTINYELRALATFFGWAIRNNLLMTNPVNTVERFRIPKRALPKFMTSEELRGFLFRLQRWDRRLFMTILLSGMRRGEVEYLTWEDVSFELGVIFIQAKADLGWQPKTDERIIPMSPMLHEILLEQHRQPGRGRFVFPNQAGEHDTHLLQKMQKVCRKAAIRRGTVHALRHSFGAHLRMAGVNLADIADLLGHKDIATTQIYSKVLQDHLRGAVSKLTPLVTKPTDDPASPQSDDKPPLPKKKGGT